MPPPTRPFSSLDPRTRHNIRAETYFSAFNGVFVGLALMAAPVVAVVGVSANAIELTCLMAAFPIGVLLGPMWMSIGRTIGMRQLVLVSELIANLALLFIFFVEASWLFTLIVAIAQIFNAAMRMGQSSLYHLLYPREVRGRVLGRLTFWTYLTMVPSLLVAGWLLGVDHTLYQYIYPAAGLCGLVGCAFYHRIVVPDSPPETGRRRSLFGGVREVTRILKSDRAYRLYQISFFLAGASFFMSAHVVLMLINERFSFTPFELTLWLSVAPQLMLALSSPIWGRLLDRVGIARCRMIISSLLCAYLACYWLGIVTSTAALVCVGAVLFGLSNGGGQVTWALSSSHFAPRSEDVPAYNGVHFLLNGVRGLGIPWLGSVLWLFLGPGAVLAALGCSVASLPSLFRLRRIEREASATQMPVPVITPTPAPAAPVAAAPLGALR